MTEYRSNGMAQEDVEAQLHQCEVASVVRMYREKGGDHVKKFLLLVEKHRGSEAATRLRSAALEKLGLAKVGSKP